MNKILHRKEEVLQRFTAQVRCPVCLQGPTDSRVKDSALSEYQT